MITLATPPAVQAVLGGATTVSYDKLVLDRIEHHTGQRMLRAQIRLTSTTDTAMPVVAGTVNIDLPTARMLFEVDQLDLRRVVALTAGQVTAVQGWIDSAQQKLEDGLISIGIVDGTRSAGV